MFCVLRDGSGLAHKSGYPPYSYDLFGFLKNAMTEKDAKDSGCELISQLNPCELLFRSPSVFCCLVPREPNMQNLKRCAMEAGWGIGSLFLFGLLVARFLGEHKDLPTSRTFCTVRRAI